MDKRKWKKISHIFDLALTLPRKHRATCIKSLCADETELQDEMNALIASVEESDRMLDAHLKKNEALFYELTGHMEQDRIPDSLEGTSINDWKVIELLGRGGMADVYKAERIRMGIHQKVALKILRRGLNTPENVRRFRLEQQILAELHHPNISGLIDCGVAKEGLPYLVMEYVDGLPVTEYCDRHQLSIRERLCLFKSICGAVQHAHVNLIIHRDLKPDNILVTKNGHVKILDFGIAKLLNPDLFDLSAVETRPNIRLMSLAYAAPEQIAGETITTSTDVYSLGMLLYELLTGLSPFNTEGQSARALEQAIKTTDPPLPGRRISQLKDSKLRIEIAKYRSASSSQLIEILRGDLDAIIVKALQKKPDSRYDSVGHFENDVENYLKNRPVLARERAVSYQMKKILHRHRWKAAAAAVVVLSLMGD